MKFGFREKVGFGDGVKYAPASPSPYYYSNIINILNYYYNLTILID